MGIYKKNAILPACCIFKRLKSFCIYIKTDFAYFNFNNFERIKETLKGLSNLLETVICEIKLFELQLSAMLQTIKEI